MFLILTLAYVLTSIIFAILIGVAIDRANGGE